MVVDDQLPFRRAARAVVDATEGFSAICDAESGSAALRYADQLRPDLALIDVQMPEMDGFETARRLTESHPKCVVVLVSLSAPDAPGSAMRSCGAASFLLKQEFSSTTLRRLWSEHAPRG